MLLRIFLFACSLFTTSVWAAEATPIAQLEAFLKSTTTLTADFKQVTLSEQGNPTESSFGVFYLQRPGKFHWQYQKPFQQKVIANGGKVWFYDADLEQVTIKKLNKSVGSTPALLLSGDISLKDNFTLEEQGKEEGMVWVRLLPKQAENGFKYVMIGLNQGGLAGMEMSDNFGQLTRIYFSNVKNNVPIPANTFKFEAPSGVDVFTEE